MDIHDQQKSEVDELLKKERRKNTVLSIFTSIIICAAVILVLCFQLIHEPNKVAADGLAIYSGPSLETSSQDTSAKPSRKPVVNVRLPARATLPKAFASNYQPAITIPIVNEFTFENSEFADSTAESTSKSETDQLAPTSSGVTGKVDFFGQGANAKRVVYVMDFSTSMGGGRDDLMKEELIKSIKKLPHLMKYQLIFFSTCTWVAGSDYHLVERNDKYYKYLTKYDAKSYLLNNRYADLDLSDSNSYTPSWRIAGPEDISESIQNIQDTKTMGGTNWTPAMKMARMMKPAPDLIVFLTDGRLLLSPQTKPFDINYAIKNNITINTISFMQREKNLILESLASKTGGSFSSIDYKWKSEK